MLGYSLSLMPVIGSIVFDFFWGVFGFFFRYNYFFTTYVAENGYGTMPEGSLVAAEKRVSFFPNFVWLCGVFNFSLLVSRFLCETIGDT